MSTVLFESVTHLAPLSCQPHSLNLNIVATSQINNLTNQFKHDLSISSSSHKCPSHFMQSSLQTPPPTPRRPDGFAPSPSPPAPLAVQTRNYPRHLSFPTPRRLASPDSQGNYTRIEDKLTEYSSDFAGVPVDYVRSSIRKRGKKCVIFLEYSKSSLFNNPPCFSPFCKDCMISLDLQFYSAAVASKLWPSNRIKTLRRSRLATSLSFIP